MYVINIGKNVDTLVDVHASQRLTASTAMLEQSLPTKTLLARTQNSIPDPFFLASLPAFRRKVSKKS